MPDMETSSWGLGKMGSVWRRGAGRPGPPERGKDKQSMSDKGRDNMGKDEEEQSS